MIPMAPTSFTASIAACVSRSIAVQSGLDGDEFPRIRDFIRRIAALKIRLGAIEDRRRDRDIAFGREAVAHRADMVIDAENFLDHHDGRLRLAGGVGAIGTEFETVRSRQFKVFSHG